MVCGVQLLQNDVLAHEASIDSVTEAGRQVIVSEAGADASDIRHKLDELRTRWEDLLAKMRDYQMELEKAFREVTVLSVVVYYCIVVVCALYLLVMFSLYLLIICTVTSGCVGTVYVLAGSVCIN